MQNVTANDDLQSGEIFGCFAPIPQGVPQGQRVEQGLCWMFVLTVTGIEDRAVHLIGDQLCRSARSMPDDDGVGMHGVQRYRRVDQRFALLHARLRSVHVDHVRAETFARDFKA